MRKSALLLAALIAVTVPSLAEAKKAKRAKAPAAAAAVDNSKFFMDAARQWVVPAESLAGKPAIVKKHRQAKKKK